MAKLEETLYGDFEEILKQIEDGVMHASMSATLEDASDFRTENARCSVRVFERYSAMGANRVSMNVTLFQSDEAIQLSAITSSGSQAVFHKINTYGEETFLDTLREALNNFLSI